MSTYESAQTALPKITVPTLVGVDEAVRSIKYELDDICTIGRHSSCHLCIEISSEISRLHVKIERVGFRYILTDTMSANGTFVNGSRIRGPHVLVHKDLIGLGSKTALLQYFDDDPTDLVKPPPPWLTYDEAGKWFYLLGHRVELPAARFRLLLHMYYHAGELCTREQCATILWGEDNHIENLDQTISQLRQDLARSVPQHAIPGDAIPPDVIPPDVIQSDDGMRKLFERVIREKLIVTRRGQGYILYVHPADADATRQAESMS